MNDEAIGTMSDEFSVVLDCSRGERLVPCNIPLPRQSHLGKYEGLDYRPTYNWREIFLCTRHGRVYERSPRNIQLVLQARGLHQHVSPLWQLDCECGQEGCGKRRTIYTGGESEMASIVRVIMQAKPELTCDDHLFVWRQNLIRGVEIAH
jgi:hypothetical protein